MNFLIWLPVYEAGGGHTTVKLPVSITYIGEEDGA